MNGEAYLKENISSLRNFWLERYPDEEEIPEHVFSAKFEKKMEILLGQEKIDSRIFVYKGFRTWLKIAIIAAVVLSLMTVGWMVSQQEKIKITIVDRPEAWEVWAESVLQEFVDDKQIEVGYMLPDLRLESFEEIPEPVHEYRIQYTSDEVNQGIYIMARKMDRTDRRYSIAYTYMLDKEVQDGWVNDSRAKIITGEGNTIIYWAVEDYLIELHSKNTIEEALQVAESIRMY